MAKILSQKNYLRRCPFLLGEAGARQIISRDPLTKAEKFWDFRCGCDLVYFNINSEWLERRGCLNGGFTSCPIFVNHVFSFSVGLPLVCPLADPEKDRCKADGGICETHTFNPARPWWGDYRTCPIFSRWYWRLKALKALKGENTV